MKSRERAIKTSLQNHLNPSREYDREIAPVHPHLVYTAYPPRRAGGRTCGVLQPLSPREAEVVALVAEGKTNVQIGATLELSPATVKHYLANAMRKTGVDNRTSVAKWWWERKRRAG